MRVDGSVAVVTGAASGLGAGVAAELAGRGGTVVGTDLSTSDGAAVLGGLAGDARFVAADITDEDGFAAVLDAAEALGPIRILVHCAGRGGDRLRLVGRDGAPSPLDAFRQMLEINLVGTYNVLRMTAARMVRNEPLDEERGAVVLTASVAAFDGQIGQTSYAAAKAGIHGMTLVAARDLASAQVRVNTIAPGVFDTPMLARLRDDIRADLIATVPHPRRLGAAADFAHLAASLIENRYVNGETVRLDGALRMSPR
jgi:NAD(P)-dependent dehydrogenase (short-subunit alcohol dehydrogenase family)